MVKSSRVGNSLAGGGTGPALIETVKQFKLRYFTALDVFFLPPQENNSRSVSCVT